MSDALVIIPTYNEIENIGNIIDAVMALPDNFDVLVIDDASPDGTQDAVKEKIEQYPERVHMETRTANSVSARHTYMVSSGRLNAVMAL